MQAHKFLLALASSVFRTGFFGEFEQENKIDMKETTLKAFKIMIEIIYKLPVNFKNMSVDEVFELVNLAERYDLLKLKAKLKQELETKSLAKDSVVEVARTAMKFKQFEEVSQVTLKNCAETLTRELDTKESLVQFFNPYYGTGEEVTMMKLMSVMHNLQPPCSNCRKKPCKSGTVVTSVKQVRVGTVLAPNSDCNQVGYNNWNIEQRGEAVVDSIEENRQAVMVGRENRARRYASNFGYSMIYKGIPRFRFHCRK